MRVPPTAEAASPPARAAAGRRASRDRLRSLGRALALAATALALAATSAPRCEPEDRGDFDADTTCGPPGLVTLSYAGAGEEGCCADGCWALLDARGAAAVGLPAQGELRARELRPPGSGAPLAPGAVLTSLPFALVGDAPVAGAAPPARVRRICHATPSATAGVVDVTCGGDAPEAACAGTLTLRPVGP